MHLTAINVLVYLSVYDIFLDKWFLQHDYVLERILIVFDEFGSVYGPEFLPNVVLLFVFFLLFLVNLSKIFSQHLFVL
jgi:hypothetical protein